MSACRTIELLLPGDAEGSLAPREAARCAEHLAACPRCRRLRAELDRLAALLAAVEAPAVDLPSGGAAARWVLDRAAQRRPRPWLPALWPAMAALALACAAGWWLTSRPGRTAPAPRVALSGLRAPQPPAPSPAVPDPPAPQSPSLPVPAPRLADATHPPHLQTIPTEAPVRLARRRTKPRAAPPAAAPAAPADATEMVEVSPAPGPRERRVRQPASSRLALVISDDERGRSVSVTPQASQLRLDETAED